MWSRLSEKLSAVLRGRNRPSEQSASPDAPDAIDSMIPDYSVAEYVGGGSAEEYKAIGREQVVWLRDWGELRPGEDVLEVGCGIGRIAAPLTQYLQGGTYRGFDIVPHGIEWCQRRITARYPNFQFYLADIYNKFYNPGGKQRASEYSFPFPDRSFDFVFLTSVFTHMLAEDVERYTSEIGRVLRPGGRCYCTAYLITDEAKRFIDLGQSLRRFQPLQGDRTWTDNPAVAETATAYPDKYLFSVFEAAGMEVRRVIAGEWWRNQAAQDTFVAHRK